MIFGHAAVIVQNRLGKRPEAFDPVDMVLGPSIDQALAVIDGVMFALAPQRLIAPEGIGVIDGAWSECGP